MTDRRTYGTEWNTGCAALSAAADPQPDTAAFGGRTGTGTGDSAAGRTPRLHTDSRQGTAIAAGECPLPESRGTGVSGGV